MSVETEIAQLEAMRILAADHHAARAAARAARAEARAEIKRAIRSATAARLRRHAMRRQIRT